MRRHDLLEMLRQLGIPPTAESRSGWIGFLCPFPHPKLDFDGSTSFHYERHASAGAKYEEAGASAWHCLTCKRSGRISSLVRQLGDADRLPPGKVQALAHQADLLDLASGLPAITEGDGLEPTPEPLDEDLYEGAYEAVEDHPRATAYLRSRGIGPRVVAELGLVYDPEESRIMFPVRDEKGRLYGYSGRSVLPNGTPKIKDARLPKRHLLLGEHLWTSGKPILLVEGLFGLAHLHELRIGYVANLGAMMGSVLTDMKAARLSRWSEKLYLLPDNDEAGRACLYGPLLANGQRDGRRSALAVAERYGLLPFLHLPVWPSDKADPDELTYEEVTDMLSRTPPYSVGASLQIFANPFA